MTVGKTPENGEAVLVEVWRERFVKRAAELDDDRGGHDWYSLWIGLVLAHNQPALANWNDYLRLGFPVEMGEIGVRPVQQHAGFCRACNGTRQLCSDCRRPPGECSCSPETFGRCTDCD